MKEETGILIGGATGTEVLMDAGMANRHGMIAGATGTGKTITMQILAEGFSRIGVPVFLADVKGDVSGLALAGKSNSKIEERLQAIGIEDYRPQPSPVIFWDLYGKLGHPVRATVSELGPLLLSNLLELNETQTGVLYAAFKLADDNGLLLLDLEDLQSLLVWMADNTRELRGEYGNFTSASIGAIQRDLLVLEEQDAEVFLGEPVLNLEDLMRVDLSGRGVINILDSTTVLRNGPRLYATFLIWLLSELFENLPEVGDAEKPKFVMFFDEAHLLFDDAPDALVDKIEQVVRLIRSKGVGVYFVSQSPLDIPEEILGQLGLKVQHALRAFTPKERKAVHTVAQNFRQNPELDTETVITELETGEALVSTLDAEGAPTPVERTLIRPPESRIGPATGPEREQVIDRSPLNGRYEETINRESAHELLQRRAQEKMQREAAEARLKEAAKAAQEIKRRSGSSSRQTPAEAFAKNLARSFGTKLGGQGGKLVRGILGSLFGGR
ncbi:MAG: helicase HerA-like domain-containing protein [Pseudomonadota bacterium]|nr:helicase HerA-like domain-containing protein [Pseudomonadota bacterium]